MKAAAARRFAQVDVFTREPLRGNPLAVVVDGEGLSTEEMLALASWTNLSETTFLLPPTDPSADYRVRIFSPGRELPFAGHPTLGSCHAWLAAGGKPRAAQIVQQCDVGLVTVRRTEGRLWFAAPARRRSGPLAPDELSRVVEGLRVSPAAVMAHSWCDNGPGWRAVMLGSAEAVLALEPDPEVLAGLDVGVVGPRGKVGVVGPRGRAGVVGPPLGDADERADRSMKARARGGERDLSEPACDFEVRAFFTAGGALREDPVTGSLNAAIAQWLIEAGFAPPRYVASQGTALGRAGRVFIEQDQQGTVWVGGDCVEVMTGSIRI